VATASPEIPFTLRVPTGPDGQITSAAVSVDGRLEIRASSIHIALESDPAHRIDSVVIGTPDPGAFRFDYAPTFHVELALPTPRPIGTQLWVVVTAYDDFGHAIGLVRRPVLVGSSTAD
jgi:hypothetical protein